MLTAKVLFDGKNYSWDGIFLCWKISFEKFYQNSLPSPEKNHHTFQQQKDNPLFFARRERFGDPEKIHGKQV